MPTRVETVGGRRRTRLDAPGLAALIRGLGPVEHAVVERVASRPGQGVASTFSFGRALGAVEGVLAALGIDVTFALPAAWKRSSGLPTGASKAASRDLARSLWPDLADQFRRVKDDGRAEAALIGRFGVA